MSEIVANGVGLMGFGMGTVFVFLTILVFAVTIMSSILQKIAPEQPATPAAPSAPSQVADDQLLKVLKEAVKQYKNNHK